jgi:hypothetical protein
MVKLMEATQQEGGNRVSALKKQRDSIVSRMKKSMPKELAPTKKGQVLPKAKAIEYYANTDKTKSAAERKKEATEAAIADGWRVK